jgi:hypothetical protein
MLLRDTSMKMVAADDVTTDVAPIQAWRANPVVAGAGWGELTNSLAKIVGLEAYGLKLSARKISQVGIVAEHHITSCRREFGSQAKAAQSLAVRRITEDIRQSAVWRAGELKAAGGAPPETVHVLGRWNSTTAKSRIAERLSNLTATSR